jgi:hypothetical protein
LQIKQRVAILHQKGSFALKIKYFVEQMYNQNIKEEKIISYGQIKRKEGKSYSKK